MAQYDLKNFSITRGGGQQVQMPRITVEGQLVNSETGAVVRDFTGANSVDLWNVLRNSTVEEQEEIIRVIVDMLVDIRLRRTL